MTANAHQLSSSFDQVFTPARKTLDLKGQDGGDEHQNLIAEITEMRGLGLFITVIIGLLKLAITALISSGIFFF